jgi:hypothetical protein
MKKHLLQISFLMLSSMTFAQVANGDFETWDEVELFDEPQMGIDVSSSNYEIFLEAGQANVTEIQGQDGSAVKLENISVGDEVYPAFFLLGGTPDQEGESLVFPGGLSISDQNISGIAVDMAYDFPGESSGFVIVQIKNAGTPVGNGTMGPGTFFFPLSGSKDLENSVFNFEAPIGVEFDQMVIGFATADLIGDDESFTAGAWMEIDNISFVNSAEEVENGDFENWSQLPSAFTPQSVVVETNLLEPAFAQSTDASEGAFALSLMTRVFEGFADPSSAVFGSAETPDSPIIEISESTTSLSFDYKYQAEQDVAVVDLVFYNSADNPEIPVYGTSIELDPSADYQTIEFNLLELLDENQIQADQMSLMFYSSQGMAEPAEESVLTIDNIVIQGALSNDIREARTDFHRIYAAPNPTTLRTTFHFSEISSGFYRVFNGQGYPIEVVPYQNKRTITHDLTQQPAGMYIFRFYDQIGIQNVRVMKL